MHYTTLATTAVRAFDVLPGLKARGFLPCRSRGTPEGSCFAGSRRGEPWSYAASAGV